MIPLAVLIIGTGLILAQKSGFISIPGAASGALLPEEFVLTDRFWESEPVEGKILVFNFVKIRGSDLLLICALDEGNQSHRDAFDQGKNQAILNRYRIDNPGMTPMKVKLYTGAPGVRMTRLLSMTLRMAKEEKEGESKPIGNEKPIANLEIDVKSKNKLAVGGIMKPFFQSDEERSVEFRYFKEQPSSP